MKHGKWCPNGCGKSALIITFSPKIYRCERCEKEYSKEQIDKIN